MFALVGIYHDGWRRPLEGVEVWYGTRLCCILSPELHRALVRHYVEGADLAEQVRQVVGDHPRPRLLRPPRRVR